jgi:hypothetical protein
MTQFYKHQMIIQDLLSEDAKFVMIICLTYSKMVGQRTALHRRSTREQFIRY